ncbi:type VII secretion integral membrane protein EccD [Agromyces protaetiae]|uniref:Type VII secretion integral membrane protein EccD n=1 Tax=Agromyces protaetiae TaxID=2509455 RepID=A0A4V0YGR6_9MICO|nr:type VII secretion integral membrane protein EccD [Agromyces protaetiae]QAY72141.1 type VII secretion integral membrane protein EccD [Agromyces protaetiae]
MAQNAAAGGVIRLSIVSEDRRLDVGLPTQVPLVELIPGFARSLGVLDPTLAHTGYALQRADGKTLDSTRGAGVQGVQDGELLTLARGGLVAEPRVYDDIVEAVIDATARQHDGWTERDSSRTALAISIAFLALSGLLLVGSGAEPLLAALIAGSGAVVLLVTAAVLGRLGQAEASHALSLAAASYAGLAGLIAVPAPTPWGWPLAAAGLGLLVGGGVGLAIVRDRPEIQFAPIVLGAAIGLTGSAAAILGGDPIGPWALLVAIAATVSNLLPWLALSSTRLRAISPQSDAEIFDIPEPIDADEVKRRSESGARTLIALRIAFGLAILIGTTVVASGGVAGAALCALAFVGLMFQSRQVFARTGVFTLMALGAVGLAMTGLVATLTQPDLRVALLIVLLAATAVLVGLTLLSPRSRLRLARVADTVEVIAIALLLPLGVATAGLV